LHVKEKHVWQALDGARGGPVAEGNVGGGTGMTLYDFKGGIGTASRVVRPRAGGYTVGVLAQCNFGERRQLRIAGVPVGREIPLKSSRAREKGSIIVVIATDAPLLPHQLKRLARRASLGLARTGSVSGNGSGDIFLAFSTANAKGLLKASVEDTQPKKPPRVRMLANLDMDPLFTATVEATEEAIINALVAADTMSGVNGNTFEQIPYGRLQQVLKKYNRLVEVKAKK
jgi:L-aminopeptidase/D-esterase-like protein